MPSNRKTGKVGKEGNARKTGKTTTADAGRYFQSLIRDFTGGAARDYSAGELSGYDELRAFRQGPRLEVLPEHLIESLSVQQIEEREQVSDPLSAAPDLPFGHLNTAWTALLQSRQPGDELWSFKVGHLSEYTRDQHTGYVLVRNGVPGGFVHSELRRRVDSFPRLLREWKPPD